MIRMKQTMTCRTISAISMLFDSASLDEDAYPSTPGRGRAILGLSGKR